MIVDRSTPTPTRLRDEIERIIRDERFGWIGNPEGSGEPRCASWLAAKIVDAVLESSETADSPRADEPMRQMRAAIAGAVPAGDKATDMAFNANGYTLGAVDRTLPPEEAQ